MDVVRTYPVLMHPEIIVPIISISTCFIMGILGILYIQFVVPYPPETVISVLLLILLLLLCFIVAKIKLPWENIWMGIGIFVAVIFMTMGGRCDGVTVDIAMMKE